MYNKIERIGGKDVLMNTFDIELLNRNIELFGEINDELASNICTALRALDRSDDSDITIYINSPGGVVTAGLYIYDTIKSLRSDVRTVVCGEASSMGAFISACAGTKGKRYALSNSEILIHQPLGGFSGQESDIRIHAEHITKVREKLNKIFSSVTSKSMEEINRDTERDYIMTPEEALSYGLIDHIGMPS